MSLYSLLAGRGPNGFGYGSSAEQVTEGLSLTGKTFLVTGCGSGIGRETARVLALLAVAQSDAQVACWDSKYTYWTERPITADPDLDVLFPTPPFPSYPSGHATISNAAAVVLSHLFPEDAADLLTLAEAAAASR